MKIITTKSDLKKARQTLEGSVGFAPTMGSLHEGHLDLMRRAKSENQYVLASIFVNPTQFGEGEDFESYPRDLDRDAQLLEEEGVDILFAPSAKEIYPSNMRSFVEVEGLSDILIGTLRPGHFRGVTTIVTKLFHLVKPDKAYFGEKDYQQLTILKKMVTDLDFPLEIIAVPTKREADGLAMSSRNTRLSPEARAQAPILHQALQSAKGKLLNHPQSAQSLQKHIENTISQVSLAHIQSVDICDAHSLEKIQGTINTKIVALLSVKFGDVFLIDNMVMMPRLRTH